MNDVLYSKNLKDMFDTCIVDGKCVKARSKDPETLTKEEIETSKINHSNILVQENKNIYIFCSKKKFDDFISLTKSDEYLRSKYEQSLILISHS